VPGLSLPGLLGRCGRFSIRSQYDFWPRLSTSA